MYLGALMRKSITTVKLSVGSNFFSERLRWRPSGFILGVLFGIITSTIIATITTGAGSLLTFSLSPEPLNVTKPCVTNDKRLVLEYGSNFARRLKHSTQSVRSLSKNPLSFNVWNDLLAFTGLNDEELITRLKREGRHHFIVEHLFANPNSSRELALYYRSSLSYLFANAMHAAKDPKTLNLTDKDGPVLDYSGGVGTMALALAYAGIPVFYFGIGVMEFEFAQFRVKRHGLEHMVKFVKPYATEKGVSGTLRYDAVHSLQKGKSVPALGAIIALDVFEHIPHYEVTARHLASLIRPGGKMIENSPFDAHAKSQNEIHIKATMPMKDALAGFEKVLGSRPSVWIKK